MAPSTLLGWANSVRMTMANDPGRELFQEHVQTHGFSFLDNYLNDILSGANQDPVIELVKTPGRKKAISQKIKFASKLAQVSTAPLAESNEHSTQDRKNHVVGNDLTQALLSAKQGSEVVHSPQTNQTTVSTGTAPSNEVDYPSPKQHHVPAPMHNQPELSVIAEDDEAMDLSGPVRRGAVNPSPSGNIEALTAEVIETHSITQDKTHSDYGKPTDLILLASASATPPTIPVESVLNDQFTKVREESANADIIVPLRDEEVSPISPKAIIHKGVLPTLPTLPEPVPLRKSMRSAKDLSLGNVMQGAATPGNTGAGKRTSWLMKAREVKAMEGIPKKLTVAPTPTTTVVLSGFKRKSDDAVDSYDQGDEERLSKAMKTKKEETVPAKIATPKPLVAKSEASTEALERHNKDEILDLLKKTVQTLEARTEKPSNKLSGNTAIALAEARAQAEARIAERNHNSNGDIASSTTASEPAARSVASSSRKLESSSCVNDLFPSEGKVKDKSKSPGKDWPSRVHVQTFMPKSSDLQEIVKPTSTSTTPPHSPPSQSSQTVPVFNKPSPVFIPPLPSSARPLPTPPSFPEASLAFPSLPAFTKPASMTLGISPRLLSPVTSQPAALGTQSSLEPMQSDNLFGDRGNTEAWVPSTRDTEYSSIFRPPSTTFGQQDPLDDDDSWPIDAKASQGVHWPFSEFGKEDSMTWSTHPSQNYDVISHSKGSGEHEETRSPEMKDTILPNGLANDMHIERKYDDAGARKKAGPDELTVSRTTPSKSDVERGPFSTTAASSQSQVEFFGQSSKLTGSIGKKEPEAKKVTQSTGVLAKKQEDDKKVARLKEMENRRQIAMQRKAEEEKIKQQEQERKVKDEAERRKREREEQVEKKSLKSTTAGVPLKKDEEITKKRKLEQERPEKKQELKKQISFNKSGFRPTASKQVNALSSSTAYNASLSQSTSSTSTLKLNEKPSRMPTVIPTKDKMKSSQKAPVDEEHVQPSQIIQTQMAARAKAAMQTEPLIPSESIELPEVNSEYSDSEDEDRARTFDPPGWAQSPELRQALEAQSTINPDDIFGEIRPLRMEELFKAKASRFRPRSSSANWSGADRLTVEEEREYARRMGFK